MFAIAAILLLGTSIMSGPAPADPPRTWPAAWRAVTGPRIGVADAASARSGDLHLITGGFTEGLEATSAIQYLHESRGWQPIGQAMLHPRAGHSLVKLDDERIMVLGGWSGRLPDEVIQRIDAEIFEPLRPERRRLVPSPLPDPGPQGLLGHSLTRLADGRVVLVFASHAVVFDPLHEEWSAPLTLDSPRRNHAAYSPDGHSVVLVGGEKNDTIETLIPDPSGEWDVQPWTIDQSFPLQHAGLVPVDARHGLLVGGVQPDGQCSRRTWTLDVHTRQISPAMDLPWATGISRPLIARTDFGLVVVSGEYPTSAGPRPVDSACFIQPASSRTWLLPGSPGNSIRQVLLMKSSSSFDLLGGYRYRAPERKRALTDKPAAHVLEMAHHMSLGKFAHAD